MARKSIDRKRQSELSPISRVQEMGAVHMRVIMILQRVSVGF